MSIPTDTAPAASSRDPGGRWRAVAPCSAPDQSDLFSGALPPCARAREGLGHHRSDAAAWDYRCTGGPRGWRGERAISGAAGPCSLSLEQPAPRPATRHIHADKGPRSRSTPQDHLVVLPPLPLLCPEAVGPSPRARHHKVTVRGPHMLACTPPKSQQLHADCGPMSIHCHLTGPEHTLPPEQPHPTEGGTKIVCVGGGGAIFL